jgi:hypothetical protein
MVGVVSEVSEISFLTPSLSPEFCDQGTVKSKGVDLQATTALGALSIQAMRPPELPPKQNVMLRTRAAKSNPSSVVESVGKKRND